MSKICPLSQELFITYHPNGNIKSQICRDPIIRIWDIVLPIALTAAAMNALGSKIAGFNTRAIIASSALGGLISFHLHFYDYCAHKYSKTYHESSAGILARDLILMAIGWCLTSGINQAFDLNFNMSKKLWICIPPLILSQVYETNYLHYHSEY